MLRFMKTMWCSGWLAFFLAATLVANAQQPATSDVETLLGRAREEIRSFEKAGGRKDAPDHPVGKWVQTLWALYDQSPRSPGAAKAASEAVHLLIHADRFQEAYQRA